MEPVTVNFKLTEREFLAACRTLTLGGAREKLRVFAAPPLWAVAMTALLTAGLGLGEERGRPKGRRAKKQRRKGKG